MARMISSDELLAEIARRRRHAIKLADVEFWDAVAQALRNVTQPPSSNVTDCAVCAERRRGNAARVARHRAKGSTNESSASTPHSAQMEIGASNFLAAAPSFRICEATVRPVSVTRQRRVRAGRARSGPHRADGCDRSEARVPDAPRY